jgi:hypothetical protein
MKFIIEVYVQPPTIPFAMWRAVHPSGGPAYEFATRDEAERTAKSLYPDHYPTTVRVTER